MGNTSMFGGNPSTTNNEMELTAVVEAINTFKSPAHLHIFTDSQYVLNSATKWIKKWKKRGWKNSNGKPVANKDLWERYLEVSSQHKIDMTWVKGHSGIRFNEEADRLAEQGAQSAKRMKKPNVNSG